ncbi:MAG: glycosyltransferase [Candidatus Limnocylindrales bacterium]
MTDPGPGARPTTPMAWRCAALGTLAGGVILGDAATRPGPARTLVIGLAAIAAGAALPIAIAGRRPPIRPGLAHPEQGSAGAPGMLTATVVVAARDEGRVIGRLIADLAAQDLRTPDGTPRFNVVVIDDRSVDATAEIALSAAADHGVAALVRVVRRRGSDLPDGKGAALTAMPPDDCSGDVVVVLDADARIGRSFLRTVVGYVEAGAPAVTARRRILEADATHLAGAQADEQTLDGELQRGRWALGGLSEFRGDGIVIRRDLLARVGGWRAEALTEDLDLSSRVAAQAGVAVAWAIDAEVWEEPVQAWPALWRQRLRWAEGAVRRTLEHGPAVVSSRSLGRRERLDFAVYAGQLAVPPIILGAALGGIRRRRLGTAATVIAAYLGTSAALGWDALRWETVAGRPLSARRRAGRAARVGLFSGVWLGAVPGALWRLGTRRGSVRYERMAHGLGPGEPGTTDDGLHGGRHLLSAAETAAPFANGDSPVVAPAGSSREPVAEPVA